MEDVYLGLLAFIISLLYGCCGGEESSTTDRTMDQSINQWIKLNLNHMNLPSDRLNGFNKITKKEKERIYCGIKTMIINIFCFGKIGKERGLKERKEM